MQEIGRVVIRKFPFLSKGCYFKNGRQIIGVLALPCVSLISESYLWEWDLQWPEQPPTAKPVWEASPHMVTLLHAQNRH